MIEVYAECKRVTFVGPMRGQANAAVRTLRRQGQDFEQTTQGTKVHLALSRMTRYDSDHSTEDTLRDPGEETTRDVSSMSSALHYAVISVWRITL